MTATRRRRFRAGGAGPPIGDDAASGRGWFALSGGTIPCGEWTPELPDRAGPQTVPAPAV